MRDESRDGVDGGSEASGSQRIFTVKQRMVLERQRERTVYVCVRPRRKLSNPPSPPSLDKAFNILTPGLGEGRTSGGYPYREGKGVGIPIGWWWWCDFGRQGDPNHTGQGDPNHTLGPR